MRLDNPWESKVKSALKSINLERPLPLYAFQFIWRHLDGFKVEVALLSVVAIASYLLKFATIALLSYVLSNLTTLTEEDLWRTLVPLLVGCVFGSEVLDYITRRYSEALPQVYADLAIVRLYESLLSGNPSRVTNLSGEKVITLFERYASHLQTFLNDFFWSSLWKLTTLIAVLGILLYQSPLIFAVNILYIVSFLWLAFSISRRFSTIAEKWSVTNLDRMTVLRSFSLHLPTVQRLFLRDFFAAVSNERLMVSWSAFNDVRKFHAKRWFLQLNLFNVLYLGTLVFGIFQVRAGVHGIGLLLLVKWAYDQLWAILVYMIEYWVVLVQQREDAKLVREAIASVFDDRTFARPRTNERAQIESLCIENAFITFEDSRRVNGSITVSVPRLYVSNGEKIGIVGPSGSGKSTVLSMILNQAPFTGKYTHNGQPVTNQQFRGEDFSLVSNSDPLFRLSIRENLTLGRNVAPERMQKVLDGVCESEFCTDLSVVIGDPKVNLSAGQEQRLRLARGLLRESDVYLLDEPFNSLDSGTRSRVAQFVKDWLADKTVIVVSHVAEDLEMTSRICTVRDGVLSEG